MLIHKKSGVWSAMWNRHVREDMSSDSLSKQRSQGMIASKNKFFLSLYHLYNNDEGLHRGD